MSNATNKTTFDIFKRSDEERLRLLYQENRIVFLDFAIANFDCDESEAGTIFRQAFTILYLNIKKGTIQVLTSSIEEVLRNIGESLLKKKYAAREKQEIVAINDVQIIDFDVIATHQTKQTKTVLTDLLYALGEPCRSILKLAYFNDFSVEEIAQQTGYLTDMAKKKKSQCIEELKEAIENQPILKATLLNN